MKVYKKIICFFIMLLIIMNMNVSYAESFSDYDFRDYDYNFDFQSYKDANYDNRHIYLDKNLNNEVKDNNLKKLVLYLVGYMADAKTKSEQSTRPYYVANGIKGKIIELYNNKECNLETIKELENVFYESNKIASKTITSKIWNGTDTNSDEYIGLSEALKSIDTGTNTELQETEKDKLIREINNTYYEYLDREKKGDEPTLEEWLELDEIIGKFLGVHWDSQINGYAQKVKEKIKDHKDYKGEETSAEKADELHKEEMESIHAHKNAILGDPTTSLDHSVDEVLSEAANFLNKGNSEKIDAGKLKKASDTIYNIMLSIGIVASVITGIILALKFIFSSVEEQAKVKESLIPYIVGCVVIFGAFIIWKLAIVLLSGIA